MRIKKPWCNVKTYCKSINLGEQKNLEGKFYENMKLMILKLLKAKYITDGKNGSHCLKWFKKKTKMYWGCDYLTIKLESVWDPNSKEEIT